MVKTARIQVTAKARQVGKDLPSRHRMQKSLDARAILQTVITSNAPAAKRMRPANPLCVKRANRFSTAKSVKRKAVVVHKKFLANGHPADIVFRVSTRIGSIQV